MFASSFRRLERVWRSDCRACSVAVLLQRRPAILSRETSCAGLTPRYASMACDFFAEMLISVPESERIRKSPRSSRCRTAIRGRIIADVATRKELTRGWTLQPHGLLYVFAEERADLVEARGDVRFADLDQPRCVMRLEHEHGDEVRRLGFFGAEGAGENLEVPWEVPLVFTGQPAQIDRGTHDQKIDGLQAVAVARVQLAHQCIHALHPSDILVDDVEENGIHELPKDLCSRRVTDDGWPAF